MMGRRDAQRGDVWLEQTRDHLVPRCHGGGDEPDNIVLSCRRCNDVRGATPPEVWGAFAAAVLRVKPGMARREARRKLGEWRREWCGWVHWAGW